MTSYQRSLIELLLELDGEVVLRMSSRRQGFPTRQMLLVGLLILGLIAVDERGAEASAATVIGMDDSGMPPASVALDRPFMFAIAVNETGTLLFMGRVLDPTAG